jgi:hypothetical protein
MLWRGEVRVQLDSPGLVNPRLLLHRELVKKQLKKLWSRGCGKWMFIFAVQVQVEKLP